jgi:hypothetical protein
MDVLLQIVQPGPSTSTSVVSDPPSGESEPSDVHAKRADGCSADVTGACTIIGCLRLRRPPCSSCRSESEGLGGRKGWWVSMLQREGEVQYVNTMSHAAVQRTTSSSFLSEAECTRSAVAAAAASTSPSVRLSVSHLVTCTSSGHSLSLTLHARNAATSSLQTVLCHKMLQLISSLQTPRSGGLRGKEEQVVHPPSSTVFFCGDSVGTRKEALYLTSLHHLLVECIQQTQRPHDAVAANSIAVDLSLVTCYELWGTGDILASDSCMFANQGAVTWFCLSSSSQQQQQQPDRSRKEHRGNYREISRLHTTRPSTHEVSSSVQKQLREWFARVDGAAAIWSQLSSSPAVPLTTADKMRYVQNCMVICTLRFRASDARHAHTRSSTVQQHGEHSSEEREGRVAYLSLALLPDGCGSGHSSSSTLRTSATLWREYEALSDFVRSFPDASQPTGSFAATARATLHAAALRRSRWLTTLAGLQCAARGTHAAARRYLQRSTPTSFSWVGCVSADWAHCRATRSTLSLLSRLTTHTHTSPSPPPRSTPDKRAKQGSSKRISSPVMEEVDVVTVAAADVHSHQAISPSSSSTSLRSLRSECPSPRPLPQVPQPYRRSPSDDHHYDLHHLNDNSLDKCETQLLSPLPSFVDEDKADVAVEKHDDSSNNNSNGRCSSVSDLTALVASLKLYTSTLETEVQRLRSRLARYEGLESDLSSTPADTTRSASAALQFMELQRVEHSPLIVPSLTSGAAEPCVQPSLPPSVESAAADLRTDEHFPAVLRPKLDALLQCVADAHGTSRSTAPTSTSTGVGTTNKRDDCMAQLQLKVAVYEQRLALVDHYVTPALHRCADEIDHCLQPRIKR